MKMKWMAAALLLLAASGCLAQEMDEKNDPALHAIIYTPHRVGIAKAQQRDDLRSVWTVTPFIGENYQRTNKFLGVFVELYGDRGVANTGSGGLMFRVDGQRVLSPSILAHSHRQPSCYL